MIDDALPGHHLAHLRHVFRPSGPFWREHHYDALASNASRRVGYFSYLYPLRSRPPTCSVEVVVEEVWRRVCEAFPHVAGEATVGEGARPQPLHF